MPVHPHTIRRIASQVLQGNQPVEVLKKAKHSTYVVRTPVDETHAIILKFFISNRWRKNLRRICGIGPARREYRIIKQLKHAGVSTPDAIASRVLIGNHRIGGPIVDVLACQDLGKTQSAFSRIKKAFFNEQPATVDAIENQLIDITQAMIHARILDADHRLANFVFDADDRLYRLDFECAAFCPQPTRAPKQFGLMLGKLIASYIMALQPETQRPAAFTQRLYDLIHPPANARQVAAEHIQRQMQRQARRRGVDTDIAWLTKLSTPPAIKPTP